MPHHDPTEFPENPCLTEECVWEGDWYAKRKLWCAVCFSEQAAGMKVEVEISQNRRVGERRWVPALIGLMIANPTGAVGPSQHQDTEGLVRPEVAVFIDLNATQAKALAGELMSHVALIERGEAHSG